MPRLSSAAAALVLFALAFALPAIATAAQPSGRLVVPGPDPEWVEVANSDLARGFVDRNSFHAANGVVQFVGRMDFHEPREDGATQVVHREEIDCGRRAYRILAIDVLGAGGALLGSHRGDAEWEAINADSPNDALHREHCR